MKTAKPILLLCCCSLLSGCSLFHGYDVVIRNGTIHDGSGEAPFVGDVAIKGDRIAAVGVEVSGTGKIEIDASGLAVAPGLINMLSWATQSLIEDGRSMGDIKQGVTLEVFGEGESPGPLNAQMRDEAIENQGDIKYDIAWETLGDYLNYLEAKGVSTNVASFVGATTVRRHVLGHENRAPSDAELDEMRELVRQAMREGALGVGSSLIYAPAFYAKTDELIALCKVAAEYDGMYISHIRSEGDSLLEALDELITIAREADIPAEVYHFKALGRPNWGKLDEAISRIEAARGQGLHITADMYTYPAASTGLDACIPPWAHEGGREAMNKRIKDPATRQRILEEMRTPSDEWENLMIGAGSAQNILLAGFKSEQLKPLTGKTLAEVATERQKSPEETALDLILEDNSRITSVFFVMSEENVRKKIALPWMSFCSDAGSMAPEGVFLKSSTHPRAYGTFSRLLGKYARDERVIPLQEAIRKLTSMPARNMKIKRRGLLEAGYFADVIVFDPETVADRATYDEPHQLAVGMKHVFVNGKQVLKNGEHTGAKPGRVVRGPGWKKR